MSEMSTGRQHGTRTVRDPYPGAAACPVGRLVRRLSLTDENNGTTVISGPVVDQAALHGLLQKVRDIGLPLISVQQIERDHQPGEPAVAPRPGQPIRFGPSTKENDMTITEPTTSNDVESR